MSEPVTEFAMSNDSVGGSDQVLLDLELDLSHHTADHGHHSAVDTGDTGDTDISWNITRNFTTYILTDLRNDPNYIMWVELLYLL